MDQPPQFDLTLEEAREELLKANDARNKAYWEFTRCTKGRPVPKELTKRVYDLIDYINATK